MTSVTGTALNIYLETRDKAREIAERNGMPCVVDMPFEFKGRGMKSKISVLDDNIYIETADRNIIRGDYSFSKDHLLTRYLLQNIEWDKKPKEVELKLRPSKTLNLTSLDVEEMRYEWPDGKILLEACYNQFCFNVPVKSVDALDTVFFMYTNRKPKLEDFTTKKMTKDHKAEADIRGLPTLPEPFVPEVKTREGFAFPVEEIVRKVENYRGRAIERYRKARNDIKSVAGGYPSEISCGVTTDFWKDKGFQFSARVAKPRFLGHWLDSAHIKFSNELPLDTIGYHINGRFGNSSRFYVDTDKYLNAKSVLDLIDKSSLTVIKTGFRITKNEIVGDDLNKRDIIKMFDLATKVSSCCN